MLAVVNTPNGRESAEIQEVAEPKVAPNEALVKVEAFSLNRGELTLLKSRPAGWRPGQDIAGTIIQSAQDGSGPAVGSRVVGLVEGAGWSQKVNVRTTHLAALPPNVSFGAAASLPIAGLTALRTLRMGGSLLGKKVLITGASGGVGTFAVQLAKRAGAEVTAVVSQPEKGQHLQKLGAKNFVTNVPDAKDGLYDLILEATGGETLTAALKLIASNGVLVIYGNSSNQNSTITAWDLFPRHALRIELFVSYLSGPPESFGQDLALLNTLVANGELDTQISQETSWRNLSQALEALRQRQVSGKVILDVD